MRQKSGTKEVIFMSELIRAGARSWYLEGPTQVGIIEADNGKVWLIDAGGDKDAGRRIKKVLDAQGWTLAAILCTHSHADHMGGCRYLQGQYDCPVYAPGAEALLCRCPILEPSLIFGGFPPSELRHKFLLAQSCDARDLSASGFPNQVEPIPLPGHYLDMVGYRAPDGVIFLADCLAGQETLRKYAVTFLYDAAAYLDTLRMVCTLEAPLFVPAHAPATTDIVPLAQLNIQKTEEIADLLVDLCGEGSTFEAVLQRLFTRLGLTMTVQQNALVGCTVRSYLTWLKETGRLAVRVEDNLLLWAKA